MWVDDIIAAAYLDQLVAVLDVTLQHYLVELVIALNHSQELSSQVTE